MGSIKLSGRKGLLRGRFNPPPSVAGCILYFGTIMNNINNDADFANIKLTKTAAALLAIGNLQTAEEGHAAHTVTTAARNEAFRMMISKCKAVLAEVIKFANENLASAIDIYQRNDIYIITRKGYSRELIEVRHGTKSGTFKLLQKSQGARTSYIWMVREKGTSKWKIADFSHKATGMYLEGISGTVYEFRAQYNNKKGMSPWSYIVEIICL